MVKKVKLPPSEQPLVQMTQCISHYISVFLQPLLFIISVSLFFRCPATCDWFECDRQYWEFSPFRMVTSNRSHRLYFTLDRWRGWGTGSAWFKDQKHNYSWMHCLVYYIFSFFRHRNRSDGNAAQFSHFLPCNRSTPGPSVPFHCAAHLPKPGWTWDQCGGTHRLYSFCLFLFKL